MKLDTSGKVSQMSDRWQSMRTMKRAERLDEENDRLRTELRMTKSQLDRERDRQQDVLDALKRASERKTKVTAKPRGGLFRLVVVGGAAYIFGTKAGRDRYEQIRNWFSSMTDRMSDARHGVDPSSTGTGPNVSESGIRPTNAKGSVETSGPRSA